MGARDREFIARFDELYRVAFRVASRLLGDREAAQDVAQEALTRAYVHWNERLGRHPDQAGWVARVSANLACDVWRGQARGRRPLAAVPDAPPVDAAIALRLDLHDALARLSRRQREVVVLRYLADLPEAVVAEVLGCSAGSAKQHASRALAALRLSVGDGAMEAAK